MNTRSHNKIFALYILDILLLSIAFIINQCYKYGPDAPEHLYPVFCVMVMNWIFILMTTMHDHRHLFLRRDVKHLLSKQFGSYVSYVGLVSVSLLVLDMGDYSRIFIFGSIGTFILLKSLALFLSFRWISSKRRKGRHMSKVLVVGAGELGAKYFNHMKKHPELGYNIVGFLDDAASDRPDTIKPHILGNISQASDLLKDSDVDSVVIALPQTEAKASSIAVEAADFHGKRIRMVLDYTSFIHRRVNLTTIHGIPMINVDEVPLDKLGNYIVKRSMDVVASFCALILLSPIYLIVSILIKCDSPGPIFYTPIRINKGGNQFGMLKFRSMYDRPTTAGPQGSTVKNDPRITKVGKWLRKSNLDELPQLWNVFTGDMSLIGPRPHRVALNEDLQNTVSGYMIRCYVQPGISGWAQVNGWRGPTETDEQREQRTRYDLWYVENWSLWLDIKIVWLTVFGSKTYKNAF